jgi:hypothetical protein
LCVNRQDNSKANRDVDRFSHHSWVEIELPIPFRSDAPFENIVTGALVPSGIETFQTPQKARLIYSLRQREASPLLIETILHGVVIVNISGAASLPDRRRRTAE